MDQTSKDMINHYRLTKDYVSMEEEYKAVIEFLEDKLSKAKQNAGPSLRDMKKLENQIKVLTYDNKTLKAKNEKIESKLEMLKQVTDYVQ